jgi:hypothetical protein
MGDDPGTGKVKASARSETAAERALDASCLNSIQSIEIDTASAIYCIV